MMEYTYAKTNKGEVRGYIERGVHNFKGIPYAAPPVGKLRFKPPVEGESWEGVRDALEYGNRAIQGAVPFRAPDPSHMKYMDDKKKFKIGNTALLKTVPKNDEDCLFLNVWTPGVDDKKRPVIVWLHGGGFTDGSGDLSWTDGANLSFYGDVVTVSINHRLAVFGFMYLAEEGDPYYKDAVDAGLQDMVMALKWVHENIANFGGDPENVMITGNSGGGQKVNVLCCMPSARGLFQKAYAISGGFFSLPKAPMLEVTRDMLDNLGITDRSDMHKLAEIPAETIRSTYLRIIEKYKATADFGFCLDPVVDGNVLPCSPFSDGLGQVNPDVLYMACSTKDDGYLEGNMEGILFDADTKEKVLKELVNHSVPEGMAEEVYEAYYSELPEGRNLPNDVLFAYITDLRFRQAAIKQTEFRVKNHCAPAYLCTFSWETPIEHVRAFHGVGVPFMYRNLEFCPKFKEGSDDSWKKLQDLHSDAILAFARTGNPSTKELPVWEPYNLETRPTMDFDKTCTLRYDPLKKGREVMNKVPYMK